MQFEASGVYSTEKHVKRMSSLHESIQCQVGFKISLSFSSTKAEQAEPPPPQQPEPEPAVAADADADGLSGDGDLAAASAAALVAAAGPVVLLADEPCILQVVLESCSPHPVEVGAIDVTPIPRH